MPCWVAWHLSPLPLARSHLPEFAHRGRDERKALNAADSLWLPAVVCILLFVILGYFTTDVFVRLGVDPGIAPLGAGVAVLLVAWFLNKGLSGWAFMMTGLTIALSTITIFQGLFPRVMISSLNHAWDLTIHNASSSPYTLTVMCWIAITFVPIVLGYQIWNYWIFRQRLSQPREHYE